MSRFVWISSATTLVIAFSACGNRVSNSGDASVSDMAMNDAADMAQLGAGPDLNTGNGGGADMNSPSGDMAGGTCNTLANTAPTIQQTMVNQPMPSPSTGGTIVDGIYYLTASTIYQGAPPGVTPLQLQVTQSISGAAVESVQHIAGSPNTLYTNRTYATSGTTLTLTSTCGGSGAAMLGFDATSTQYTIFNDAAKTVNVYTKQ